CSADAIERSFSAVRGDERDRPDLVVRAIFSHFLLARRHFTPRSGSPCINVVPLLYPPLFTEKLKSAAQSADIERVHRGSAMRLGKQWKWAGLGVCALLAANAIKAQEPAVPSQPVPIVHGDSATPPPPPPPPVHEAAPQETEGDGASWFSGLSLHGDYLLVRPRRNALDFAV